MFLEKKEYNSKGEVNGVGNQKSIFFYICLYWTVLSEPFKLKHIPISSKKIIGHYIFVGSIWFFEPRSAKPVSN